MQGFGPDLDGYADPELDLERYVHTRTQEWVRHWQDQDVHTTEGVRAHATRVREAVLAGIGGLPQRPDGAPEITVTGSEQLGDGGPTVERVIFESLPGVGVTASLYRPAGTKEPGTVPAVLFACGHSREAKGYPRYHSVAASLAEAGMVVLVVDPHGQGERVAWPDSGLVGVGEHLQTGMSAWWLGQSLMRWMVTDLIAGVDVLCSLPEVDQKRIGVTGNSGGGTQTSILMAIEPRLAAAAPGTYITSRLAYQRMGQIQDAEQHLPGGTVAGVDHADLLIAFAPKPLRVLAAAWDFFAIEGTRSSMERARRAYAACGAESLLTLSIDDTTHSYSPGLERASVEFFCDVFELPVPSTQPGPRLEPGQLESTETGQLVTDDPGAVMITDLIAQQQAEAQRADASIDREWLAERVYRNRRRPVDDAVRWIGTAEEPHLFWNCEEDLWGAAVVLDPETAEPATDPTALTLILLPDGTRTTDAGAVLPAAGEGPRVVLDVRGLGALTSRQRGRADRLSLRGYDYKLLCDLLWLDDSLAAGRVYDIVRAIEVLTGDREFQRRWPGLGPDSPVDLVTVGGLARWHADLAAIIEPRIRKISADGATLGAREAISGCSWDETRGNWQGLIPGIGRYAQSLH